MHYNIMFLGPPSVGKTHLGTSLAYEALDKGYSVSFVTLDELIKQLKTAEISPASKRKINYYKKAHLIVIERWDFYQFQMQKRIYFLHLSVQCMRRHH